MLDADEVKFWNALHSRIGREQANQHEKEISRWLEVFRYRLVRKYCSGHVLEFGCGSGYGAFTVALNPDVKRVTGIDADAESAAFANREAAKAPPAGVRHGAPCVFLQGDVNRTPVALICATLEGTRHEGVPFTAPDVVMAVETIEHLEDPQKFVTDVVTDLTPRCLILTFPSFKTTHYNPHHLHDLEAGTVNGWVRAAAVSRGSVCRNILYQKFFDDHWVLVWEMDR